MRIHSSQSSSSGSHRLASQPTVRTARRPGRHRDLLARALPDLHQRRRVAQELLAGRRQRRARLVAHEELAPEQVLERAHARAHGRLRDVQALGSARKLPVATISRKVRGRG